MQGDQKLKQTTKRNLENAHVSFFWGLGAILKTYMLRLVNREKEDYILNIFIEFNINPNRVCLTSKKS